MRLDPSAGDPRTHGHARVPSFAYVLEAPGPVAAAEPSPSDLRLWDAVEAAALVLAPAEPEHVGPEPEPVESEPVEPDADWEDVRLWEDGPAAPPEADPEIAVAGTQPGDGEVPAPLPSRRVLRRARRLERRRNRHPAWKFARRTVLVVGLVVVALVGNSVRGALVAPGTDSMKARLAIWVRDHGGTPIVNYLERVTYKAPKVGGLPAEAIPARPASAGNVGSSAVSSPTSSTVPAAAAAVPYDPFYPAGSERFPYATPPPPKPPEPEPPAPEPPPPPPISLDPPDAIAPVARPAIADEGVWQTLKTVKDKPALMATYLRADSTYTSYLSAVAWMDTKLLDFEHRPGNQEPGGSGWGVPQYLTRDERPDVVAAFNSGFRIADSRGGFYLNGKTSGTMRNGAATMAFYDDGAVEIGQWGREITWDPHLTGARQNLDLIVDDGRVNARINENVPSLWGATIGNELFVWRTGVGVTETGALVFAAGPRLTAATLAQLLIRAGAVRAMQLDINASWTIFVSYDEGYPNKLLPSMLRPANVYDSVNSRDFIVARVRD